MPDYDVEKPCLQGIFLRLVSISFDIDTKLRPQIQICSEL